MFSRNFSHTLQEKTRRGYDSSTSIILLLRNTRITSMLQPLSVLVRYDNDLMHATYFTENKTYTHKTDRKLVQST